ncbi:MAG: hypothetical protein U1A78_21435 [Polyangia bacterium]
MSTATKPAHREAPRVLEPKEEGSAQLPESKQEQSPDGKGSQRGGMIIALAFFLLLALFLATNMK